MRMKMKKNTDIEDIFKNISGGLDINTCTDLDIEGLKINNQKILGYLIGLKRAYKR